jgi:subtilisin family serine protease
MLLSAGSVFAQAGTPIFVELKSPAPKAVARFQAKRTGKTFDEALYRAALELAQNDFLQQLTNAGVPYTLTSTPVGVPSGAIQVPDRYTELINAVRLIVAGNDVRRVRANPNVKHITVDVPRQLVLNTSVPYIRANCPPPDTDRSCSSARSHGLRGQGAINSDGSASGQVIAVLDTGIHAGLPGVPGQPMFDDRVSDDNYLMRNIVTNPDLRPVRQQGVPFNPAIHHTKVVYRALFGVQSGDDVGHGTMCASTAAGLKVRIPDTDTNPSERGLVLEGVAPGALLMDYKVCPSLVCTGQQILLALQDAAQDFDVAGFPKPRATVVNMSFGDKAGDENSADSIAAGNLQFLGVVPEASAGNDGPSEQIIGNPAAGRLVVATAATNDPGKGGWSADVLDPSAFNSSTTGSVTPANGFPAAAGQRTLVQLFPMQGSPNPPAGSMAQYYVFVRNGQTPADFPFSVNGRIALVKTSGALLPATLFAQVANNAAAAGAVAVLFLSGVETPTAVVTTIPAANVAPTDGQYLINIMTAAGGDPPVGTVSRFPLRINPPGSIFRPDTASFSSRGPLRSFIHVKPDITAPGVNVLMGASPTGVPVILGDPDYFNSASGTSFSGPHISGTAALIRDANRAGGGQPDFSPSQVRAALMNGATNLRLADRITPVPDSDSRNFIHATGAGLVEMVRATSVKAIIGTNEVNGPDGPDDPTDPDFLPSYSFGQQAWIGTNLPSSDPRQQKTITITVADVSGLSGSYSLQSVDGGANRGEITRPLSEPGFSLSLSVNSVAVPANGSATLDVTVKVDGRSGGLQIAGKDVSGAFATEFLWYVVATRGTESVRMPFYLRVIRGCPGGGSVDQAQGNGEFQRDDTGHSVQFNVAAQASCPSAGEVNVNELNGDINQSSANLRGTVSSISVSGNVATIRGPCALRNGSACQFTITLEDNADPGTGADRFTLQWVTAAGASFRASGLLTAGNILVRGN